MLPMHNVWEALHIHCHSGSEANDALLLGAVWPAVQDELGDHPSSEWFFVRYWKGGPHVRVRLRDVSPEGIERVKNRVEAYLANSSRRTPTLDPDEHYRKYSAIGEEARSSHEWRQDHEVVRTAYHPETARYGGTAGLPVSEQLFARSSEIALVALRLARSKSKKLGTALDLTVAFVLGLGLTPLEAVGWLRSYAMSWSYSSEAPSLDVNELRLLAEAEFFAHEDRYLGRLERIAEAVAAGEDRASLLNRWSGEVGASMRQYRELEEKYALEGSALGIMKSQLHMFNNRLDVSVAEECYLAWLAALSFSRAPFTSAAGDEDGPQAPDRSYHEHAKLYPTLMDRQRPNPQAPQTRPPLLYWEGQDVVRLPKQALEDRLAAPLGEILLRRRSSYGKYGGSLGLDEVSTLLGASAGVVGLRGTEARDVADSRAAPRTYPSAGARYPIQIAVCANRVEGMPAGLYVFDDSAHALRRVSDSPPTETLLKASPFLDPASSYLIQAEEAPLWLFPVADFSHHRKKYKARSYRFVLVECGHVAQNICLVATALGLSSITIGGYYDDMLNSLLYADGVNQAALYMIPVARPGS